MADKSVTVREYARTTLTFLLTKFRDASQPGAVQDITGYAFRLVVKRDPTDADASALVDLAGSIVTAASGTFKFDLTAAHTSLPPGSYSGEIRWWTDGTTTNQPHDAWTVNFTVTRAIDQLP